jgi:hypothetical protein
MKSRISCVVFACAALLVVGDAGSANARPRPGEATGDDTQDQQQDLSTPDLPPQAPSGYVIVEDDLWAQHHDQPTGEFEGAEQNFVTGEIPAAAEAIRRGASYVRAEGSRAEPDDRDALQAASDALELLAKRVESEEVQSITELESAFARADHAVASHHLTLARKAQVSDKAKLTGVHLQVAAHDFRRQLTWQHTALDSDAETTLARAEKLASQLQQRGASLGAEVPQALADVAVIIASHSVPADGQ